MNNVVEYIQKKDISEEEVNTINKYIDEAVEIIEDTKDLSSLEIDEKAQLQQIAVKSAETIGLNAQFDKDNKGVTALLGEYIDGNSIVALNTLGVLNLATNFDISIYKNIIDPVSKFNSTEKKKIEPVAGYLNNTGTNNGNVMLGGFGMIILSALIFVSAKRKFI